MAIPNPLPGTLEAAVDALQAQLSDEDKRRLATMPDRELAGLHLSLGMMIRNDFGLWGGNARLITALDCWESSCDIERIENGVMIPCPDVPNADNASGIIIYALMQRLRDAMGHPHA